MKPVVVIGAGLGGLSAAIRIAASSRPVIVLEALPTIGGKAGIQTVDGVSFDTGPSVITMPDVFDTLFQSAGTSLREQLELLKPDPFVRYLFDGHGEVDFYHDVDATLASVGEALGSTARHELTEFLTYAQRIWDIASPPFVYGPAPSVGRVMGLGPSYWAQLPKIDATRTMWQAITKRVSDPHLRAILARFATYNGSDARQCPATLNCIAHVEITLGGYGIRGGVEALVQAMGRVARGLDVDIRTSSPVASIDMKRGKVRGVVLKTGEQLPCDSLVVNADVAHLQAQLLEQPVRGVNPIEQPSMSGWTGVFAAAPSARRAAHTVVMSDPYIREFEDIFDHNRPPEQPTVYLCDQGIAHGRRGWEKASPVFAMANCPAEPLSGSTAAHWDPLSDRVRHRAIQADALAATDQLVWSRTPSDLARFFPHTRGAIYGAASHGMMSAFRRPANQITGVKGLYLASGSAHPGGGMPLAVLSGLAAAEAMIARD